VIAVRTLFRNIDHIERDVLDAAVVFDGLLDKIDRVRILDENLAAANLGGSWCRRYRKALS
jgi:hypothetical protein